MIQRFGSAANLNLHLHCLVFDGVYRLSEKSESPQFVPLRQLDDSKLPRLLENLVRRILRHLIRQGLVTVEHGDTVLTEQRSLDALATLQWASCTYRIAFGSQAGKALISNSNARSGS